MQGFIFYHEPRINLLFCHIHVSSLTGAWVKIPVTISNTNCYCPPRPCDSGTTWSTKTEFLQKRSEGLRHRGIFLIKSSYSFTVADRQKWGKCLRFIRPQGCFLLTRHHDNTENHQTYQGMPFSLQCPLLAGCSTKGCSKLTSPFPLSWDRNGLGAFSLRMLSHFDQSKTLETATI